MTSRNTLGLSTLLILVATTLLAGETMVLHQALVKELLFSQGVGVRLLGLALAAKREDLPQVKARFDTILTLEGDHEVDKSARTSTFGGSRTDKTNWNVKLDKTLPTGTTLGAHFLNARTKTFGANAITGTPQASIYEPIVELELNQDLGKNFFGRLDRAEVRKTKYQIEAFDYQTRHDINRLVVETETLFWNWVVAKEGVQIAKEALLAAEDFVRLTEEKEELGIAEKSDRLGAESLVSKRRALYAATESHYWEWEAELKTYLNLPKETNLTVRDFSLDLLQINEEKALEHALAHRLDLLSAMERLKEREIRFVIAKKERWPTVDLDASLQLNEVHTGNYEAALGSLDSSHWKVGMTLEFPLENRKGRGLKRQEEAETRRQLYEIKYLEHSIIQEVVQKRKGLALARRALASRREAIRLEGEKLRFATEQFMRGRFNAETILKYQDDYLDARQQGLQAKLDLAVANLALREAVNKDL